MKSLNKYLLLTSILTIGLVPTLSSIPVQAASNQEYSVKKLNEKDLYFLVGKNELVKAKDIKIITNDSPEVIATDEITASNDAYKLEIIVPKADIYNLKGTKLSHTLSEGTVCSLGDQNKLAKKTYYKVGNKHLVPMTEVY